MLSRFPFPALQLTLNSVEISKDFKKKHLPYRFTENHLAPLPPPSPRARNLRGERERVYRSEPARAHQPKSKLLGGRPGPSRRVARLHCPNLRQPSAEAHLPAPVCAIFRFC